MGVITDASEALSTARYHLREAIKHLYIFVNPDTYGHADWDAKFVRRVSELIIKLQKFI